MILIPSHLRPILEAPFKISNSLTSLGRSLWLYQALILRASDGGTVLRSRQHLAEDLEVTAVDIDRWLERLVTAKLIELQSPPTSRFLVISLRLWPRSGDDASDLKNAATAGSSADVPASAYAEKENKKQSYVRSQDGGAGEGTPVLTALQAVLGEGDAAEVEPLLAEYPEATVRRVLDRVRATPSRQIKKSRTALFRYLLKNASNQAS
jgi:hypothetical protein